MLCAGASLIWLGLEGTGRKHPLNDLANDSCEELRGARATHRLCDLAGCYVDVLWGRQHFRDSSESLDVSWVNLGTEAVNPLFAEIPEPIAEEVGRVGDIDQIVGSLVLPTHVHEDFLEQVANGVRDPDL